MADLTLMQRARQAVSIRTLAEKSTKLMASGRELRGACPICDGGRKTGRSGKAVVGASPPFAVNPDKGKFRCYACDEHGDVVDLEQRLNGGTVVEAAWRLIGGEYASATPVNAVAPPEAAGEGDADAISASRLKTAGEMWAAGRPIMGTLAERYLRARCIPDEIIALAARSLLFHPFARVSWDDSARVWIKAPALLIRPCTWSPEGAVPTGGVHATYLLRDGSGRDKALGKRMWGPQHGADGRQAGAWLIGPQSDWAPGGDLVNGEGLETVLSLVALRLRGGAMSRACVALSLNRLQGGEMRDADNCVDPYRAHGDPERPPFVWPAPADDPWGEVIHAIDRDMSPVKVRGKTPRGRVCEFQRDGETRARLCGALAVQAWTRPVDQGGGGAARSRAIAPPARSDFNDELRRVVALECAA